MAIETTVRNSIASAVEAALPAANVSRVYRSSIDVSSLEKNTVYAFVRPFERRMLPTRGDRELRITVAVVVVKRLSTGDQRDTEIDEMLQVVDDLETALDASELVDVLEYDDAETGRRVYDEDAIGEQGAFVATLLPVVEVFQ